MKPWLITSLLLTAAHTIAALLWPAAVLVTAVGLGGQALIIAYHAAILQVSSGSPALVIGGLPMVVFSW